MTSEQQAAAPVEYRVPLRRAAQTLALSGALVALSGDAAVKGHGPVVILGIVGIALFGSILIRLALRVIRKEPFIVLTAEGLALWHGGRATWTEVESIGIVHGMSGASRRGYIEIRLHDIDSYLARLGPTGQRYAKKRMRRGQAPILLPAEAFSVPLEEVVATMARFHPSLVVHS